MNSAFKAWRKRVEWKSHGWCNVFTVSFIVVALLFVFIGLPILGQNNWGRPRKSHSSANLADDLRYKKMSDNYTTLNQPLKPEKLPIDEDTPESARTWTSSNGEDWVLVFSDEFNEDGRTFNPGDDPVFEGVNLWYWPTQDYEFYDPGQLSTKDGKLVITMEKSDKYEGHDYISGMAQSWNKFCFQGGYLEVKVSLPGNGEYPGFWPAVWTLGNLGRAGYGATTDGLWPYTYNSCDEGVLVNQTNPTLSGLPGQRLNACVCKGDHPSPGIGRGAPEIDIFEGAVAWGGGPTMSMSCQVAPFDFHYQIQTDKTEILTTQPKGAVNYTEHNSYIGGPLQQSVSAVHHIDKAWSGGKGYNTYGFEYEPGNKGYVQWYAGQKGVWRLNADAIGENKLSRVGARVIPEEPMYIIMNFGMSDSFGGVDFNNLKFPAHMYIDYVRLYQHPDKIRLSCDPPDRPTSKYIQDHARAYFNTDIKNWKATNYSLPEYSINNKCK
ncbi:hypothetical protein H4219_000764 [Mycoemilia scoparia]|uniref:GH16 domain-containing protein n=1 Tax=Mycoemilia scoparia TaxID=417184 RepID=A0A9W8DWI2_9FUNG|nr:hypothetical protein H4219_000764 [Mycoemilia scoparia]